MECGLVACVSKEKGKCAGDDFDSPESPTVDDFDLVSNVVLTSPALVNDVTLSSFALALASSSYVAAPLSGIVVSL